MINGKKLTSKLPANIALIVGHHTALAFTSSTSSHVALEITTLTQTTNYEIVFNIADLEFLNENLVQNEIMVAYHLHIYQSLYPLPLKPTTLANHWAQ